ncbi:DNA-directed RNA polymerase III subunit RPC3 [Geodia barretti]|nr:DNA-directed RNA polymerase III subunit RPC3 [Geodia barretti]
MSQCINRVAERLEVTLGAAPAEVSKVVKTKFVGMVEGQYLTRVKPPSTESALGQVNSGDSARTPIFGKFELPSSLTAIKYTGNKRKRDEEDPGNQPSSKRAKKNTGEGEEKPVDDGVFWSVNFDNFHQHFQDKAIVSAVRERVDETAACVMRSLLRMAINLSQDKSLQTKSSPTLYKGRMAEYLPDKPKLSEMDLEHYLKALTDDQAHFLSKEDDSGGGGYAVDYQQCAQGLCQATVEGIVRERFSSKCLRVFRLLLVKRVLEQKQVVDMAMIPSKEARELLYSLLAENFISLQEIPRTMDYAPSRTFYLFSVNLPSVARLLLERTYQALGNIVSRRMFEMKTHKRLLEKYAQYQEQMAQLKGRGEVEEEEIEEILTPDEKTTAEQVKKTIQKLEAGELQLDETIMSLSNYIRMA